MFLWTLIVLFAVTAQAQIPRINEGGVVNAAGFRHAPASVSAGSIVTIFGTDLAPEVARADSIPLPTILGGTQVFFNDIAAPLVAVGPLQLSAQVPWELAGETSANVRIVNNGTESNIVAASLGARGPGVFATNEAGTEQGAILVSGSDGAVAAPAGRFPGSRPVERGEEYIEIYATGLGAVTNQPASGAPGSADSLSETILLTSVTIGGIAAEVTFSGLSPQYPGLYQINARVPPDSPAREDVEVIVLVGEVSSNPVTIAVQGQPGEVIVSRITPGSIDAGSGDTTILIEGAGFTETSVVEVNQEAVPTTFLSPGRLRAVVSSGLVADAGSLSVTVTETIPGGEPPDEVLLAVRPLVQIAPASNTITTGESLQLSATVIGLSATQVSWSIGGAGAGNATVGTITSDGLYTAPEIVPEPARVHVEAALVNDPGIFGAATITVMSPTEDWPKFRHDLSNTGLSAETGLSTANVHRLQEKWRYQTGGRISASPAVATVGGVRTVYIGSWNGIFSAVNADTGSLRWSFRVDQVGTNCSSGLRCRIGSSAAVENGIVYFGTENGFVYALNAATGALVWKTQLGDPNTGHEIWSSPAVYNGKVFVGVASHNAAPCVAGRVVALAALTGQTVWSFSTIDQTSCPFGTCLGAGVWSSPAIDSQFGTLFVGTGNPGEGCSPSTANATRYPDGLLALDVSDGSLKGFHQVFQDDPGDLGDVGATPVLHRTELTNQCLETSQVEYWVTVPSKDGVVHTAQRDSRGLGASPSSLPLNSGDTIASPASLPFTESLPCGPIGGQTLQSGNDLFVPTFEGALFAIRQDPTSAIDIRWERLVNVCPPDDPCPLLSAPAVVTDLVFLGGGDGNVYATTTDGTLVWEFGTAGLVASSPAISDSTVYFGSYDGYLYAVSLDGQ